MFVLLSSLGKGLARMRRSPAAIISSLCACIALAACSQSNGASVAGAMPGAHDRLAVRGAKSAPTAVSGAAKVQHVVILDLENRSFDSYFGTFPGVNGIPMKNGVPQVNCNPDPQTGKCILPFHSTNPINYGGPHAVNSMWVDIDNGKLDGFIISAETQPKYIDPSPD